MVCCFSRFVNARISAGFCQFSQIFSANDRIFRDLHAPLLRTGCFQSKTRDTRVNKKVKSEKHQTITSHKYLAHRLGNGKVNWPEFAKGCFKCGWGEQVVESTDISMVYPPKYPLFLHFRGGGRNCSVILILFHNKELWVSPIVCLLWWQSL